MNESESADEEYAKALLNSPRGHYIINQALHLAIRELQKVPEEIREESNIADMKALLSVFRSPLVPKAGWHTQYEDGRQRPDGSDKMPMTGAKRRGRPRKFLAPNEASHAEPSMQAAKE